MSLENLPKTRSGSARVRNLTHYNTEDLIDIIHLVEAPMTQGVQWSNAVEEYTPGGLEKVIEFREFTGQPRDTSGYGSERRRLFSMSRRWRTPLLTRLLPPDKLYPNPVEALVVSAEDGQELLPQQMVEQLVESLVGMYRYPRSFRSMSEVKDMVPMKGARVRINAKRKPRSRKQAILARKRELLHRQHIRATYRVRSAKSALTHLNDALAMVRKYSLGIGMEASSLDEMMSFVQAATAQLEQVKVLSERFSVDAQHLVDEVA